MPTKEEIEVVLGSDYQVRLVGGNYAIEPRLSRGQTDAHRASAVEKAQELLAEFEGVRLNVTSKTIHTLWVNERDTAAQATALAAENKNLKDRLERLEEMMSRMGSSNIQALGSSAASSENPF
jgi:hypothetical protein